MSFKFFIGLILRNWFWLTVIPMVTAVSIFFFTRNQDKEYAADTIIYTGINSGFNLKEENRVDIYTSNKAFANLLTLFNSRDTKQEVAFRLLAGHISLNEEYDPTLLSWPTFLRIHELIDKPTRQKLLGASFEETVQNIATLYHSNDTNVIYKILNSEEQGYSLKALSKLSANQISNSDLMKVDYVSNDAAMCRQTLEILSEVFIRKHKELMEGQNGTVIGYFQTATDKSAQRLEKAEQNLLAFQKKNNIINYQEQVNNITDAKQRQLQAYNELEMLYAGTLASLQEIERNLKKEGNSLPNSQEILQLRNQLSHLNTQITEYEIFHKGKAIPAASTTLSALKKREESTRNKLEKSLNNYSDRITSTQSLPLKELLNEWLQDAVEAEKLKGQLLVMRKQNQLFDKESEKVAPLGAELRRIEREKELAEKEYFNLLNGLTQSKLNQQNIALTSQLKVVDPPITPIKALSSKRILLVLAGAVGCGILVLSVLLALEFFDSSLKTAFQASRQTGLPVFGVFPLLNSRRQDQQADIKKTADQLARKLLLKRQEKQGAAGPFVVGILSHYGGEGKTTLVQHLRNRLYSYKLDAQGLLPERHSSQPAGPLPFTYYSSLNGLSPEATITDLSAARLNDDTVLLVEFPALLEEVYPVSILKHLDLVLLTVKADRTWKQEDKDILARMQQVTPAPVEILLNGMLPKYQEELRLNLFSWMSKKKKAATEPAGEIWEGEVAMNL